MALVPTVLLHLLFTVTCNFFSRHQSSSILGLQVLQGIFSAFQECQPASTSQLIALHDILQSTHTHITESCCCAAASAQTHALSTDSSSGILPKFFSCYSWGKKGLEIPLSSSRNGRTNSGKSHSLNRAQRDATLFSRVKRIIVLSNTYLGIFP